MIRKPLTFAIVLAALTAPIGVQGQRVDNRVGGVSSVQSGASRPFSAPVNRQAAIGSVQARIGPDGRPILRPGADVEATSEVRRSNDPQLMRALAPVAPVSTTPAMRAATPAFRAGEWRSARPHRAKKHPRRGRARRR